MVEMLTKFVFSTQESSFVCEKQQSPGAEYEGQYKADQKHGHGQLVEEKIDIRKSMKCEWFLSETVKIASISVIFPTFY